MTTMGFDTEMTDVRDSNNNNNNNNSSSKKWEKPSTTTTNTQVTEVYNSMKGFIKATHWSKPYYSALIHNNPQLPHDLFEHVNCSYLSTPGRAPNLLVLKQHVQSLAVLISYLAPTSQHGGGGILSDGDDDDDDDDAPFAAEQAFDWLNDLRTHYHTDDSAHKRPLNALANLIKSNGDVEGPKWHCPLDDTAIQLAEKHRFQQYRPFETHMTLLMHANEILERLDHEYSAMGGILGIIPLEGEDNVENKALKQSKTTLVGQWILFTQHLVSRMHELEIAYGNSLDLLANEAIVPMQHLSVHGPDGRRGREIVYPQDRWILANAGEDVFSFIHQMLDKAEAVQDRQDDKFAEQKVLGDAALSDELEYRGIVKVDLDTRFYRLRSSGHGPLFVLPAFADRPNTAYTREMEKRPTVVTIPQPEMKESVSSWEARHKDIDARMIKLSVEKSNLEAAVAQNQSMLDLKDREIDRLNETLRQYDDKLQHPEKNLSREIVRLKSIVENYKEQMREQQSQTKAVKEELENYKLATVNAKDPITPLAEKLGARNIEIEKLKTQLKTSNDNVNRLEMDKQTMRLFRNNSGPAQVTELRDQLNHCQRERQYAQEQLHALRLARVSRGKIINLPEGINFNQQGEIFEDASQGLIVCRKMHYDHLVQTERERNDLQKRLDKATLTQVDVDAKQAMIDQLMQRSAIDLPGKLTRETAFKDYQQGLVVLTMDRFEELLDAEGGIEDEEGLSNIAEEEEEQGEERPSALGMAATATATATRPTKPSQKTTRKPEVTNSRARASSTTKNPRRKLIISIPHKPKSPTDTFRDDKKGLIVLTTSHYDQLVHILDNKNASSLEKHTDTFRDDDKGLIVLTTRYYDEIISVHDKIKSGKEVRDERDNVAVIPLDQLRLSVYLLDIVRVC
ncbi:hypothetical protein GGS20DRAFT_133703 [Poronia punctata]|nr:hypothetical protein GGS20DRAFT_133703 [Poronia punctata]